MVRKLLKVIVSAVILAIFGNASLHMLRDGEYAFSITMFVFSVFAALMAYFTIEGKEVE